MSADFEKYWEAAAEKHGHKCPSLFYGVTLGLIAVREMGGNSGPIVLEGSSKCIRDGITTVLQDMGLRDKLLIVGDSPLCGLTMEGGGGLARFVLSEAVRERVNRWNKELPVEEFQVKGVNYLRELEEVSIFPRTTVGEGEFRQLCEKAKG